MLQTVTTGGIVHGIMEKSAVSIRILIAENQTIFRAGLRRLLARESDLEVVGEASTGREVIERAADLHPDVVLLALNLCKSRTSTAPAFPDIIRDLAACEARPRTLVIATANDTARITEALMLGARGAVLDNSPAHLLVKSIRSVMQGKLWAGDRVAGSRAAAIRNACGKTSSIEPQPAFGLTRRELQIVCASVSGYSNRQIASRLKITEDTVKHHLTHIYDKVGVYNRLELALFAIHHGLVA